MSNYHIFTIIPSYWNTLYKHFENDNYLFSCFNNHVINENDYLIFYQKSNCIKRGFIGFCQAKTILKKNTENIKIFKDKNLNTYYCGIKNINIFKQPIILSRIFYLITTSLSVRKFICKYLKHSEDFLLLPKLIGSSIISAFIQLCDEENIKVQLLNLDD
jgi:hypothetical protein